MKFNAKDRTKWHKTFCWFPTKVENKWIWLEYVKVRIDYEEITFGDVYEYRLLK